MLARHTKRFSLVDVLSIGVDCMQRNCDPMRQQVEAWKRAQITDRTAKLIIYRAFVEGRLDVAKHLMRPGHEFYFNPTHEEFVPRTLWSFSNAFTSAFKGLDPISQFKATAQLGSSGSLSVRAALTHDRVRLVKGL